MDAAGFTPPLPREDLLEVLRGSLRSRVSKTTAMNTFSSRSHLLIKFELVQLSRRLSGPRRAAGASRGSLTFVDLAGSERYNEALPKGDSRLQETRRINQRCPDQSLFALERRSGAPQPARARSLPGLGAHARTGALLFGGRAAGLHFDGVQLAALLVLEQHHAQVRQQTQKPPGQPPLAQGSALEAK